jgi:hypothetical protein
MKLGKNLICHLAIILISNISIVASVPFLNSDEIRMFDSYGKLSWKDERLRLGTVASELNNNDSKDVVYLYFYGGKQTCLSETWKRATRAKNYLINKQGILNERIVLKEGGYREALMIEIYIQPPNFTMPASPTLMASEAPKKCGNQ